MTTFLIATRNVHKVGEIGSVLGDAYEYLTLRDCPEAPSVVEDAPTFAGNALKKAIELAQWMSEAQGMEGILARAKGPVYVLADDSGLEVDALGGAPGVHSARFAALDREGTAPGNSSDAENNAKLLRLLKDVPGPKRTARFRCVIALTSLLQAPLSNRTAPPIRVVDEFQSSTRLFEGVCEGLIGFEPRGACGFGYDPLFAPVGERQTFAELGEEVKNRISHRARALHALRESLAKMDAGQKNNLPPERV